MILPRVSADSSTLAVAAGFLLLYLASVFVLAVQVRFPSGLDEDAHYAYVAQWRSGDFAMPGLAPMKLIDTQTGQFTERDNYINHPPLYYALMALLPAAKTLPGDIARLRAANVALSALGVLLLLALGVGVFASDAQRLTYGALVALNPVFAATGGMIDNDNLGILAAGLVALGLRFLPRMNIAAAALLALGLAVGAGTKLNLGLALGLLIAFSHLPLLRQLRPAYALVLLLGGMAGAAPYVATWIWTGFPIHLAAGYYAPEAVAPQVDGLSYAWALVRRLAETWAVFEPSDALETAVFVAVFGLAVWQGVGGKGAQRAYAVGASLAVFAAIHLWFVTTHLPPQGQLYGMQLRYYLAFFPWLCLSAAHALGKFPANWQKPAAAAISAGMLYASGLGAAVRAMI